jgi:signal transduction histidine kinase/ActR/RegA family two-component response regulator
MNTETVLILAPAYSDSSVAVEVLEAAGISAHACLNLVDLGSRLASECGAVVMSEEAVGTDEILWLQQILKSQPPWSDVPIILLASNKSIHAKELFLEQGNISLLERPFAKMTLVRAVQVALRARRKQYEVRDLLMAVNTARTEAERANSSKTQFLANMSHEIRTPIGAILGFTDLMKNSSNTPEENLEYMGIIERNSKQLIRLIDDILDLSKVESGKMTVEMIPFSLSEMLADFISIMTFKAQEKGIGFGFHLETLIPAMISSDPVRLRQILTNIAGNAIKFTERGHVTLSVAYQNPVLKFMVTDTGLGLSKSQEARLFRPFSQADTSTTRKFGGTGLGLVLSRRLAEALGGGLHLLETKEGIGSTFVIDIHSPLLPDTSMVGMQSLMIAGAEPIENLQKLRGLQVLLVEDSPDNQRLIATYLQKEGANVTFANNGAEGSEKALLNEAFDLVLMDIQMPVLDGHGAAKKLREAKYTKPLIALTAHAMKEERARCLESGFTEFLTKPVQRNSLIETLSRYMPVRRPLLSHSKV